MIIDGEIVEANADMILEWIRTLRYWLVYPNFLRVGRTVKKYIHDTNFTYIICVR
jgi:hypothetical protein